MHIPSTLKSQLFTGWTSSEAIEAAGLDYDGVARFKEESRSLLRAFTDEVETKEVGRRRFEFPLTNERPDHAGDILKGNGWDLSVFKANPVALLGHDSRMVVGTWPVVKRAKVNGLPGLVGQVQFLDEGISDVADTTHAMVEAGALKATSVGFRYLETRRISSPEERQKLGLGPHGVFGLKMLLLEDSIVSVPMNPDAVRRGEVDELFGKTLDELLSAEKVTKSGVAATAPALQLSDETTADILKACETRLWALGAVEPEPESDEEAQEPEDVGGAIERAKALLGDGSNVEAEGEAEDDSLDGDDVRDEIKEQLAQLADAVERIESAQQETGQRWERNCLALAGIVQRLCDELERRPAVGRGDGEGHATTGETEVEDTIKKLDRMLASAS